MPHYCFLSVTQKIRQHFLAICKAAFPIIDSYVTIDMWQPYEDVTRTYLPNAIVAIHPFHVVKHLTQDFSQLRIDLMKRLSG